MVITYGKKKLHVYLLFIALVLLLFIVNTVGSTQILSNPVTYKVDKEWVQIRVNKDGSMDLFYNITITYTSGTPKGIITLGMPKKDFQVHYVYDERGINLTYQIIIDEEKNFFGVEVSLSGPISLNKPYTIIVYASVKEMVYEDEMNPGNVGLKFYPTTFGGAQGKIGNIRVAIVLPEGVKPNEVKHAERRFSNIYENEEKLLVVYWEEDDWPPDEEFRVGVSFPKKYVSMGPDIWFYILVGGSIVAFMAIVSLVIVLAFRELRKAKYEKPRIAIEALGPARGLTAVEAAVLLDLKPTRILTMILFSLLIKRAVEIISTEPVIRLRRLCYNSTSELNLRYYEIDFLWAIRSDGSLEEKALARLYLNLRDTVNLKIRGFSRIDTINYYRDIVDRAWQQVTQAGTPELKCNVLEENIEWLLADERFEERLRIAFPPDIIIYPRPGWWWYWSWPRPQPPIQTGEVKPIPIPGQEFANNIVLAIQKTANNIVLNVQEFANQLVPARRAQIAQRPLRYPSCVCACASCACACACVSCACACAHGSAR
ncbi:MAG: hypothetical protein QXX94_03860 [Candidatus Bathyarchaeia archaeon]